jgi:hypothetical protein
MLDRVKADRAAIDLSLPKTPKRAILASDPPGEYRECRLIFILSSTAKRAEPKYLKARAQIYACQANCFMVRQ